MSFLVACVSALRSLANSELLVQPPHSTHGEMDVWRGRSCAKVSSGSVATNQKYLGFVISNTPLSTHTVHPRLIFQFDLKLFVYLFQSSLNA